MKVDRKTKAEKRPPQTKATKSARKVLPKLNGKHPLAAYEHIPIGIVETSLDGKYINVNEEFCRILGYPREELLQLGIKDCTHEDDYGLDSKLHEQLITGKIPFYRLEKRFVRKSGEDIWVELTRTLVCDAKGKPVYTMGVVLDISDRKDVEKVLRQSVERLRLTTETARMFMWEWDFENYSYILADNFEQVLGFSTNLLSKNRFETIGSLIPAEDVQIISDAFERAVTNRGDLHSLSCRVISPETGQIVWLDINAKIVYSPEGNPERMFGVAQNVTQDKQTLEDLRMARERAEHSADRTARLQKVTAALSEALSPTQVAEAIVQQGASAFGAVSSSVMLLSEDGQSLELMYSTVRDSLTRPYQRFPISLNVPAADAVRTNQVIWIESQQHYLERYPHLADQIKLWGQQAAMAIPMVYKGRIIGALTLSFDRVLTQNLEDENYVLTLARQGAQALERAHAEDALRESEERFRALVSQATAGIAQSDTESRLTFVNPRFCEMLGYSEEELLGKTIFELTYKDDVEENKHLFQRMLDTGEPYRFEKRFLRRDGSTLWTNVSVTTIHDSAGKPKGGVGVMIDIEERKQAEHALAEYARQQEALYRLSNQLHRTDSLADVFDAALEAILRALHCDRASILLYDNTDVMRFVAWRGLSDFYRKTTDGHSPWTPDAVQPQPISMDDVRTADLDESLRAVIQEEGIGALAFIPLVVNEKLIGKFMIYYNTPHTFDEAELDISLTIARQLAFGIDRKRAEEKIRRLNSELQAQLDEMNSLLEILPTGVWIGNETGSDIRGNAAAYQMLGLPTGINVSVSNPELQAPQGLQIFVNDEEIAPENSPMQTVARTGKPMHNFEHEIRFQDGTSKTMYTSIVPLFDQQGTVRKVIGTYTDITERKRTEKRLALLAEISEMLRNFEDPRELMYTISKAIGEHLQVKRVLFNEIDLEHDLEIVHRDYHSGLESVAGVHKVSDYSSITSQEVAAGKTVVNVDAKVDSRTALDYEKTYAQTGERAYVVVPMMRDNRWVASLWVSDDMPRNWTSEEVSLLETIAERTWTVIEKLRIDAELRESESRFRGIFETAGVSVWLQDFTEVKKALDALRLQGVQDLPAYFRENPEFVQNAIRLVRIVDVNNETVELFNAKDKAELLRSLDKVFVPETVPVFEQELIALAEGREVMRAETIEQTLDGRRISVIFNLHFGPAGGDLSRVVVTLTDITERKRMEEALRLENERFMRFVNSNIVGILIGDTSGRVILANDYYLNLLGVSPEELMEQTLDWKQFTPPEWLAADEKAIQELRERGVCQPYEKEYIRRDGTRVPVYIADALLPGSGEEIAAFVIDITDRKRAEEALRESEERYRFIVENTSDGIWWIELTEPMPISLPEEEQIEWYYEHAIIRQCNLGLARMYGYSSAEEVVGLPLRLLMPREHSLNLEMLRQFIRSEYRLVDTESREVASDGRELVFLNNMIGIVEDGKLTGEWGTNRDITERKRAEEALRNSEERYRGIVNQTIGGIAETDLTGRFSMVNDRYCEIVGYTRRELLHEMRLQDITHPDDLPRNMEMFGKLIAEGASFEIEKRYIRSDGSTVWVHNSVSAIIGADGKPHSAVAAVIDVTERKRAEEALRRNERMFSTLIDTAPFGVYFIDSEFRLRAVNKGSQAVFSGIDPLIGRDFAEVLRIIWKEPFATEAIERFRHTLRTGESFISPPTVEERANIDEIEAYDWQIHRITFPDGTYGVVCYFYDLSEQKQMEAAVRASETLYRAIARSIPGGGVYVVDEDFRYLVAEGPVTEAFGLTREMLEGHTVTEAFPDERGKRMEDRLRRNFAGEIVSYETQYNGRVYWTQQAPLHGPVGQVIILTLDITERKQAEEALRESEERFRAILRQATAGIVRKDSAGRLIFVNEAFCNMLGYTESELLGKTVWDFMHEEDIAQNKTSYERLMQEGIPFKLERRLLRRDGSVLWVDASVSPILDASGKPQSAVTVEVDITARKQAEAELQQLNQQLESRVQQRTARLNEAIQTLRDEITERRKVEEALRKSEAAARENEEKLSTLFDLLPVGISFLDPNGQIIQMNSALANILKLPKEQLAAQGYLSRRYIHPNGTTMSPTEFASQRALQEEQTIYNVETGVILENSDVIWTSVSAAPVAVADVGAVVVTVDITESKRAERALQESRERLQILSQRLVEVQEDERRAIARELHDRVGQTLAALNINLIIISGQLAGNVDEQIRTRLGDSMKLVAETIALVRDVMSNLRPSVLDDYGLVAALESYLSQYTARYEIEAKFDKPEPDIPRLGPSIEMTFLRIAQEALMNAARHAQASQVQLSLWREEDAVCMTVQDNGKGIQSWQEANRPGSHGITIMRERAEAFGGSLRVSSTPGKGTKIEVKIPIETNDPPKDQKEVSR